MIRTLPIGTSFATKTYRSRPRQLNWFLQFPLSISLFPLSSLPRAGEPSSWPH